MRFEHHSTFEEDDFEHWKRTGQVLDTEDDYARDREEFEDREYAKAPTPRPVTA